MQRKKIIVGLSLLLLIIWGVLATAQEIPVPFGQRVWEILQKHPEVLAEIETAREEYSVEFEAPQAFAPEPCFFRRMHRSMMNFHQHQRRGPGIRRGMRHCGWRFFTQRAIEQQ